MAPFRGTTRYASITALRQLEQSRKDDVESWFYVTVEWTTGALPWKKLRVRAITLLFFFSGASPVFTRLLLERKLIAPLFLASIIVVVRLHRRAILMPTKKCLFVRRLKSQTRK